jgi:APA family basic amino acid/polyamine antiporter
VRLPRTIGRGRAVALGLSGTFGGGIFVLVGPAVGYAGPGVLLAFVIAFLAALLFALPYAELAGRNPSAGGGYAATRATLGERWGFVMGWGYWGAWIAIGGCACIGFGGYAHGLTGWPSVPCSLALVAGTRLLSLSHVRVLSWVQVAVVVLASGALAAFGCSACHTLMLSDLYPSCCTGLPGSPPRPRRPSWRSTAST